MIGIINKLGVMIIDQCPLAEDCETIVALIYTASFVYLVSSNTLFSFTRSDMAPNDERNKITDTD